MSSTWPKGTWSLEALFKNVGNQKNSRIDLNPTALPKKRLLFIAYNFPPNAEPGTHRSFRFVRYLRKLNWEVVVLTANPRDYLPETPVDAHYMKHLPPDLEIIHSPVFRGLTKAIRFRDYLKQSISRSPPTKSNSSSAPNKSQQAPSHFQTFKDLMTAPFSIPDNYIGWFWGSVLKGWRAMKRQPFDLIFSSAPPWTCQLIAYTLSKLSNVPWVADFRDPWVRSPWRSYPNAVQKRMAELLEKAVVQRATFIILNTDWTRREFRQFYKELDVEKFQLIPNGYAPEDFENFKQAPSSRGNSFKLVHSGSLYGGRDPIPLLKAWALFIQQLTSSKDNLLLALVGVRANQKDELTTIVSQLGMEQYVELIPHVSHQESLEIMAGADLLLLLQGGLSLSVPSKIFEYMALNKPILGLTPAGAAADILEAYPLGKVVSPDEPDAILGGICSFFDERNNICPMEEISEFIDKYKAVNLTNELDHLLHRAILQSKS